MLFRSIYISMFDEYGEGNQILNTAPTTQQVPTGSGLLALDEDGTACSADYYLRLTNDGGRMLKGEITLTAVRPTSPEPTTSTGSPSPTASASASASPTATATGAPTAGCGSMGANEKITVNQSIKSCDGRFQLILGGDGNLVLYQGGTALWAAGTAGKPSADAIMQGDGNFVVYSASGSPLWSSNTAGNNGASLVVQDDGNVVIYSASGATLWSTNTAGH